MTSAEAPRRSPATRGIANALIALSPALLVLVTGLVAWMGAFAGADAFAMRASSAVVIVAWVAPAPAWAKARGGLGFTLGLASKVALFFALAPRGLATLTTSYGQLHDDYAFWQDALVYFWALPPALTFLTAVEGWAIARRLAGRPFREAWPYRRRRVLFAFIVPALAATVAWRVWRPAYYVARIRAGHDEARFALARVGPSALPSIEREIHALGAKPAGSYRSNLAGVIVEIRQDVVARRIGTPLAWKVAAAEVGADRPIVDTLLSALVDEPDRAERGNILNWMSGLDFDTAAEVMCVAFTGLTPEGRTQLVDAWEQRVQTATSQSRSDTSPWRDLSDAEVGARQAQMRRKLACATPAVIGALERDAPRWGRSVPLWGTQAVHGLSALRPLPPEEAARLGTLAPELDDGYLLSLLLDGFGDDLAGGDPKAMRALLASVYRKPGSRTSLSLQIWVAKNGAGVGVTPAAFFCDVFDAENADEMSSYALVAMVLESADPDPCAAAALMAGYAAIAPRPGIGPSWLHLAFDLLSTRSATDPRIVPWARGLLPQVRDTYQAAKLAKVAGIDPPKTPRRRPR